jgi:hypothetical protein
VVEAVHTYVNLVTGLTRVTRDVARVVTRGLLGQVGLLGVADDAERRLAKLTEEIMSAGRANRDLLENLVAGEVTKTASRWGFVRSDDLDEVREEIAEVRAQLARQQATARPAVQPGSPGAGGEPELGPLVPDRDAEVGA